MRAATVLALVVVAATDARAEMLVIEEPGMFYACPSGKAWTDVETCLRKHGKPHLTRAVQGAKLVRLDQREGTEWVDGGQYLYVEREGAWKVAGAFFGRGTDYELLDMRPLVVGKHTGYRLDFGQAAPLHVQIDGVTVTRALRRTLQTLYCGGVAKSCLHTLRACEVLVRGRAYWTFHGVHEIRGNELAIRGDRRSAGPFCAQPERLFFGWPQ